MTTLTEAVRRMRELQREDPEDYVDRGIYTRKVKAAETEVDRLLAEPAAKQPDMRAICESLGFDPTNHHNAAKCPYCRPAEPAAPQAGWRVALQFYADGDHFVRHQPEAWDTVSGEPDNFYEDESSTATVEDGSVAKAALDGALLVDDEPVAAPQAEPSDEEIEDFLAARMTPEGRVPMIKTIKDALKEFSLRPAPVAEPADDDAMTRTIEERDNYHEWADKLAEAIAQHFSVEIGEHSSANNPWAMALEAIDAAPGQTVKALVDRFLGWRLPDTFNPDCFIKFDRELMQRQCPTCWPTGTNLFTSEQAREMFEYVLAAPSPAEPAASGAAVTSEEDGFVIQRMGQLLAQIAVIVNGPELPRRRHGYDDLPDKVAALKAAASGAVDAAGSDLQLARRLRRFRSEHWTHWSDEENELVIKCFHALAAAAPPQPAAQRDEVAAQDFYDIVENGTIRRYSAQQLSTHLADRAARLQPVAHGNDEREAFEAAWKSGEIERPEHQRRSYSADDVETAERMVAISAWQARAARSKREWDVPLDEEERQSLADTIEELINDNETSTDYDTLMNWANRGFFECTYFTVTKAGQDAAAPTTPGGEQP